MLTFTTITNQRLDIIHNVTEGTYGNTLKGDGNVRISATDFFGVDDKDGHIVRVSMDPSNESDVFARSIVLRSLIGGRTAVLEAQDEHGKPIHYELLTEHKPVILMAQSKEKSASFLVRMEREHTKDSAKG